MRRLLLLICLIVLVDTAFYAAIAPLLPFYEHRLGLGKDGAGLLSASYAAGTILAALPGGWAAARFGVKRTVLAGLALMIAASVAFGLARRIETLDAARFLQGVGGACSWAGAMAWLVAEAPPQRRGELIGVAMGASIAGALLGPVLGAAARAAGPRAVFLGVAAAGGALAVAAALMPASRQVRETQRDRVASLLRDAVRRPAVAAGMWLVAMPGLLFGCMGVLAPLRLDRLGANGTAIGAVFLLASAGEAIVSGIAGRLSDRRGRMFPLRGGLGAGAVLTVLLPVPQTAALLGIAVVAASAAYGLFWAPSMAMLSDGAESAGLDQGYAFGLVNLAWAIGQVAGSAGGGALGRAAGDALPYLLLAATCVATLAIRSAAPEPNDIGRTPVARNEL